MSLRGGDDLDYTNNTLDNIYTNSNTNIDTLRRSGENGLLRTNIDRGLVPGYTYGTVIMDGICDATERTGGFPHSGYNGKTRVTFPAANGTGYTFYICSSNAGDNATSITGAQEIYMSGLGGDWLPKTEYVVLNGLTPVATATNTWLRINKIFVSRVGVNGKTNLGHITVMATNDFTGGGLPNTTNPVSLISIGLGNALIGIVSLAKNERLYWTFGNYYTDATGNDTVLCTQYENFAWDATLPNTNRINLIVGRLASATSISYNASYAAPEFPTTDIEFTMKRSSGTKDVNYSIFWESYRCQLF